jgi:very-short-patch-repair endonuclease
MQPRKGTARARTLRTASTDAEHGLWTHLRARRLCDHKFRRQFPISGFVVDFVCLEAQLIVELDGGQHADAGERDARRTAVLERSGFRVLRFWNDDVLQRLDDVLEEILRQRAAPPSPQPLSRQRERG